MEVPKIKFHENPSRGAELFHTDQQTHRLTDGLTSPALHPTTFSNVPEDLNLQLVATPATYDRIRCREGLQIASLGFKFYRYETLLEEVSLKICHFFVTHS